MLLGEQDVLFGRRPAPTRRIGITTGRAGISRSCGRGHRRQQDRRRVMPGWRCTSRRSGCRAQSGGHRGAAATRGGVGPLYHARSGGLDVEQVGGGSTTRTRSQRLGGQWGRRVWGGTITRPVPRPAARRRMARESVGASGHFAQALPARLPWWRSGCSREGVAAGGSAPAGVAVAPEINVDAHAMLLTRHKKPPGGRGAVVLAVRLTIAPNTTNRTPLWRAGATRERG